MNSGTAVISIDNLKVHYQIKVKNKLTTSRKTVRAVDGVSLEIYEGEALGIVGESGCGKSTLCRAIIGLEKATSGAIRLRGKEIGALGKKERFASRREIQMVFQDVYSTLDPKFTIGRSIEEPMVVHKLGSAADRRERVKNLLEEVGLPESYIDRFPHEFSGGQRQRVGIARALALKPSVILCDEPVSALDVSIQSQILNLMKELQHKHNITYVFVSHNLSVVRHLCDRIAVMYLGNVVELAPGDALYEKPLHPYTRALISAVPVPDPDLNAGIKPLEGDIPSPIDIPPGCPFATRCPHVQPVCSEKKPVLQDTGNGHQVACHFSK